MKRLFSKQNRALLFELVRTDFKLRYQGSVLGYAWSLLRPMMMFAILYVVFVNFLKIGSDIEHYPVYLLLGIVVWQFFTDMTNQSLGSVVARGDLIRKIRIPRWMIVLTSSISAVISLGINLVVVAVFLLANGVDIRSEIILLPLILLQVYVFSVGVSLFLSAAYVKYRDIGFIWEVITQGAYFLTPILYPITLITNATLQKLMFLNPMAQALQDARYVTVTEQTRTIYQAFDGGWYMFIPYILTLGALIIGVLYFRKESKHFAENL